MTLHEELPPRTQELCFSRINNALHDEIAEQVEAFMRSGGRIKEVPAGVTGEKHPEASKEGFNPPVKKRELTDNTPLGIFPRPAKKIRVRSNTGHLYISRKRNGDLIVRIKDKHIGTFKGNEIELAIKTRDEYCANIGITC